MSQFCRLIFGVTLALIAFAATHNASAYTYKVLYDFCSHRDCKDGGTPYSTLSIDSAGNLYGTTSLVQNKPTGTVFELVLDPSKNTWKYKLLYRFCRPDCTASGGFPLRDKLVMDSAGNLFGTALQGGKASGGTAFELLPGETSKRGTLVVLYNFPLTANEPDGGLTYVGAETGVPYDDVSPLFGTTVYGGMVGENGCADSWGCGTAFELTNTGGTWSSQTIYQFCSKPSCADGERPARIFSDADGNLYGTTYAGGAKQKQGVAFELSNTGGTWTQTILHTFCAMPKCSDGSSAQGGLTPDAAGNLFGAGYSGSSGKNGCCGTLFELVPGGERSEYNVLYNFCSLPGCRDGANPSSPLILDASGTIYGTTFSGGGNNIDQGSMGGGTVFSWNGTTLQSLYQFCSQADCTDGEYPVAGLVMDSHGNLFGTTTAGGKYGGGVVFELSP